MLDLGQVVGELEPETKEAWDEDQGRHAAAGWHAILPCAVHSGGARVAPAVAVLLALAQAQRGWEAPQVQGAAQGTGPSTTHSGFQIPPHSHSQLQSLVPEAMRRRLGALWPFARCTCHETLALQQQHLALLKQISQVETMQWEYLELGTVHHKTPAPALSASQGSTREVGVEGQSSLGGRGEPTGVFGSQFCLRSMRRTAASRSSM